MTAPSPEASPVVPHLTVRDSSAAIEFYRRAFGAQEIDRATDPNGEKVMHATVSINGGLVMMNDDFPEYNDGKSQDPAAFGGSPVTIHLNLPDVDAVWQRALDAGASVVMPLEDQFWGDRYGVLTDPFGHRWSLATHKRDVSPEELAKAMNQGGCSAE